jgi:hypothetical protein
MIGFPTSTDTALAGTLISTSVTLFMDNPYIYISIDTIESNILSSISNNKYAFYIPVNANNGDMLSYLPNLDSDNKFDVDRAFKYYTFRIRVFDNFGNILNLNGSDWSMVLKLSYDLKK